MSANQDQIDYWNGETGLKWVEEQTRLDAVIAPATGALLAAAAPAQGERVLDIGCGCGTTTLALAAAVGPSGAVLGVDISAPMLARAKERAGDAPTISFLEADAAESDFFGRQFDLVASRFGVMFFNDPVRAFANIRRAMAPGARLAFVCWRSPGENEWVRLPAAAVLPHVEPQPPFDPQAPGPFSFADPGRVRTILQSAGFATPGIAPLDSEAAFSGSLDDTHAFLTSFGPASRMLARANAEQRANGAAAVRRALETLGAGPIRLGQAQWIVTARAG